MEKGNLVYKSKTDKKGATFYMSIMVFIIICLIFIAILLVRTTSLFTYYGFMSFFFLMVGEFILILFFLNLNNKIFTKSMLI